MNPITRLLEILGLRRKEQERRKASDAAAEDAEDAAAEDAKREHARDRKRWWRRRGLHLSLLICFSGAPSRAQEAGIWVDGSSQPCVPASLYQEVLEPSGELHPVPLPASCPAMIAGWWLSDAETEHARVAIARLGESKRQHRRQLAEERATVDFWIGIAIGTAAALVGAAAALCYDGDCSDLSAP